MVVLGIFGNVCGPMWIIEGLGATHSLCLEVFSRFLGPGQEINFVRKRGRE